MIEKYIKKGIEIDMLIGNHEIGKKIDTYEKYIHIKITFRNKQIDRFIARLNG